MDVEWPEDDVPQAGPGRVTVEEVEDEEAGGIPKRPWVGEFPAAAGSVLWYARTCFEKLLEKYHASAGNMDIFTGTPFSDREEWELARWLVKSGLSQEAIEQYLTLPIVRKHAIHESRTRSLRLTTRTRH